VDGAVLRQVGTESKGLGADFANEVLVGVEVLVVLLKEGEKVRS
jgi:hypothetical protein